MLEFIVTLIALVLMIAVLGWGAVMIYLKSNPRWKVSMDEVNYDVTKAVDDALKLDSPYTNKRIVSGAVGYIKWWPTIDDPVIIRLAKNLAPYVEDMNDYDKATFVLRFVQQNTSYILDKDRFGWEWNEKWVFPVDTLKDRKGDCEDTSFLCVGLMHLLGLDVVTVSLPGHICVGVHLPDIITGMKYYVDGKPYCHAETIDNTQIGDFVKNLGKPDFIMKPEVPTQEFKSRIRDNP